MGSGKSLGKVVDVVVDAGSVVGVVVDAGSVLDVVDAGSVLDVGARVDEAGESDSVSLLLLPHAPVRRPSNKIPMINCALPRAGCSCIVAELYLAGWGDKRAIGTEMSRSRVRMVAICRPGCTAGLGSESRSPRVSLARSRSSQVSASPQSAAPPPG